MLKEANIKTNKASKKLGHNKATINQSNVQAQDPINLFENSQC